MLFSSVSDVFRGTQLMAESRGGSAGHSRRTSSKHRVVHQNPLIPARRLRDQGKVPLRSRGVTLGEEDDDTAHQDQLANASKGPEEPAVPSRGVEQPRQEVDDGKLGHREGQNARREGEDGVLDGALLLLQVEKVKVLAVAVVHGCDREAYACPRAELFRADLSVDIVLGGWSPPEVVAVRAMLTVDRMMR